MSDSTELYGPANDPGPQMIPAPQMILKLDRKWSQDRKWSPECTANDPRNGNGIFAANKGNEWTQEFGEWIYFIHSFLKLPTAK